MVVERAVGRIALLSDKTCLGAVFSWKTWGLIFLMASFGMTLRLVVTPGLIVGLVYLAVGWALLLSSRLGWVAWFRQISR